MKTRSQARGSALIITLILLSVMTIVTMASMRGGIMQERMTSNHHNKAISLMAAETGASQFLEELKEYLENNEWDQNALEAWRANHEKLGSTSSVGGYGQYFFTNVVFSDSNVQFTSIGQAASHGNVLGETRLFMEFDAPSGGGSEFDAPAAVSCIGGPCRISAGAGQGADEGYGTISGYDHPPYDPACGNSADCRRLKPKGWEDPNLLAAVPAVYLSHPSDSTVTKQGGGNHEPFQGLSPTGNNTSGQNEDNGVAWNSSNFPDDEDGVSTAPTIESLFGPDGPEQNLTDDGSQGVLVVDGEPISYGGNGIFNGLIFIKNCGTFTMSGNPNVYGAIVIDATGCADDYDPFAGGGTPAVRYSSDALSGVGGGSGGSGSGSGSGSDDISIQSWRETIPNY